MILYFSATGNSKYVAERIAKVTNEECVSILDVIKDDKYYLSIKANETVGIVSPTYAWGCPSVIIDFLKNVSLTENKKCYMYYIATYGTTPGNNGYFANKNLFKSIGREFDAYFSVKMPDTWTPIFNLPNKEKVSEINRKAEPQIDEIIANIQNNQRSCIYRPKELDLFNCWRLPARLLSNVSNNADIWQQGCRQLPTTSQNSI